MWNLITGTIGSYLWPIVGAAAIAVGLFIGYQHLEISKLEAQRDKAVQEANIAQTVLDAKTTEYKNNMDAVSKAYQRTIDQIKKSAKTKEQIHEAAKQDDPKCGVAPSIQYELKLLSNSRATSDRKTTSP